MTATELEPALVTPAAEPMTFAILGAAGFVAPRHMEAIRQIGGRIVAAVDPSDAVGVLDRYAPDCRYFRHFEVFLSWLAREKETHHVVIATPNDLHAGHARAVQELGHVPIIEKPVALSVADVNQLLGAPGYSVLQMRLHPEARRFLAWATGVNGRPFVEVTYHVRRGSWYVQSWKGDEARSGGCWFNLAIHALDLVAQAFPMGNECELDVDALATADELRREIRVLGETFDFSAGIGLHDRWYETLRDGTATTIEDALPGIALAERLA